MTLSAIDVSIIISFFVLSVAIGIWVSKSGSKSSKDYFLAGGNMPWWLLGVSMVATTFSTDTPNLVTEIVRKNGVAGNWEWWAFLLTGMLTVFVYARLWKKSGVLTDVEFYEIRYSGKEARFLRGFRALYLGIVFNVLIMASVSLAAIKIGGVLLGLTPVQTVVIAGVVTVLYSSIGGLKGVIFTDFIQFFLSMGGALAAAIISLNHPKVGGLRRLISHESITEKLAFIPDFDDPSLYLSIFLVPLLIQWWNVWYPGAEPGGGGYVAQRMLSAKNESHAVKSVFFFNIAHYAIRPWPWIIVALCSLLVFPDLESLSAAFPAVEQKIDHDLAYPAMLTFLPAGILGLVVTSLIAAYMSTISTHLNWGASYIVQDFYKRFLNPVASEKRLVNVGRFSTVLLMILAMIFALLLESALDSFQILLQIGAGTGLVFILRWFWWRVNAASEIIAMIVSFLIAIYFNLIHTSENGYTELEGYQELLISIGITTIAWISTAFLTKPTDTGVLEAFVRKVNPGGVGWKKITDQMESRPVEKSVNIPMAILGMIASAVMVYSLLIATGLFIYGEMLKGTVLTTIAMICILIIRNIWKKLTW
ncbi:MAG: sodium:solute symporter family protein [Cyclobacteriaceae bacterium]